MTTPQLQSPTPTPSRTLRIPVSSYDSSKYDYPNVQNGNVYFLTFDKLDDALVAYNVLREDKVPVRYHVYSLFTKFDELLTKEELENKVKEVLNDDTYNITYVRIDIKDNADKSHTGKVVIDRINDCKSLLSYKDNNSTHLRFYRFDPKKAIKRTNGKEDNDGFKEVKPRKYNKKPPMRTSNLKEVTTNTRVN
jgi:DNA-dependent RNA polymerase auxiliary subunit epsilon